MIFRDFQFNSSELEVVLCVTNYVFKDKPLNTGFTETEQKYLKLSEILQLFLF